MKIYFGQIKGDYLEQRVRDGSVMFAHEGKQYEYVIDIMTDFINITDTSGRVLPVDYTDVLPMLKALKPIEEIAHLVSTYEAFTNMVNDDSFIQCV